MFSIPIFKQDLQINKVRILTLFIIQMSSMLVAIGICSMELIEISDIFWDTIPVIIVPMLLEMVLAYQVFLKRVDDGTMDLILSTGNKPEKIVRTKAMFVVLWGVGFVVISTILGCLTKVYSLTGEWTQTTYLWLNVGACCLQIMISGFCFYMSCRTRKFSTYIKISVIIPIVMYAVYVLYYWMEHLFLLQYVTIFSLFRQSWYSSRSLFAVLGCGVFLALGIVFFIMGNRAFYLYDINAYEEQRVKRPVNKKARRKK